MPKTLNLLTNPDFCGPAVRRTLPSSNKSGGLVTGNLAATEVSLTFHLWVREGSQPQQESLSCPQNMNIVTKIGLSCNSKRDEIGRFWNVKDSVALGWRRRRSCTHQWGSRMVCVLVPTSSHIVIVHYFLIGSVGPQPQLFTLLFLFIFSDTLDRSQAW